MEQCRRAFAQMPSATPLQHRDKALFAFQVITAARDGAIASLRLKHIDLVQGGVYQDARDVKTKGAKGAGRSVRTSLSSSVILIL